MHACAHLFCVSVLSRQLTKTNKKHSCCLVTSLWLRIIYFIFAKLSPNTLFPLRFIVYSKLNALFLASIFCIAGLLDHVFVSSVLSDVSGASMMFQVRFSTFYS